MKDIPEFLGGQCRCEHVEGGCINSNKGPWNDYEIHGYGIRRKGEAGPQDEEAKTEEVTSAAAQQPADGGDGAAAQ